MRATQSIERPFAPKATTFDGFTLSDHLAANNLPSLLSSTRWDAVVLQERTDRAGPSAAEQEKLFFAPLRVLDAMIRNAGAKTVL